MDRELKQLEEEMERLVPAGLPDGLIARMEVAMAGWAETLPNPEEKVVPFPQAARESGSSGASRSFWAAAAAVALLGAMLAIVLPRGSSGERSRAGKNPAADYAAVSFAPTNLNRNIVQAFDDGLVFTNDDQPHRVVRVEYVDHIEFRNSAGEVLQVEKPAVNLVLIPVETD